MGSMNENHISLTGLVFYSRAGVQLSTYKRYSTVDEDEDYGEKEEGSGRGSRLPDLPSSRSLPRTFHG